MRECENCGGLGFVVIDDETDEEGQCPDCEGTGKVDDQGFSSSYSTDKTQSEKD